MSPCLLVVFCLYIVNILLIKAGIIKFGNADASETADKETQTLLEPINKAVQYCTSFFQRETMQKLTQQSLFVPFCVTLGCIAASLISELFIGKKFIYLTLSCAICLPVIIKFNIHVFVYKAFKPIYEKYIKPKLHPQAAAPGEAASSSEASTASTPEAPAASEPPAETKEEPAQPAESE